MRNSIYTEKGARPVGPYSQAIVADGPTVYVAGQGPLNPETNQLVLGSFREQAERVFQNIGILLEAAGTNWANVVKVNVYLADFNNFAEMNEVYRKYLQEPYPARTTVQAFIGAIAIEVDCIAVIPRS